MQQLQQVRLQRPEAVAFNDAFAFGSPFDRREFPGIDFQTDRFASVREAMRFEAPAIGGLAVRPNGIAADFNTAGLVEEVRAQMDEEQMNGFRQAARVAVSSFIVREEVIRAFRLQLESLELDSNGKPKAAKGKTRKEHFALVA